LTVLRAAGDELVDVAIRSPEVRPRRSWLAQQLDACPSQLVHGRGQVADGEADNRAGSEMLLARIKAIGAAFVALPETALRSLKPSGNSTGGTGTDSRMLSHASMASRAADETVHLCNLARLN
jgi:hypothetical protein